MKKLLELVWTLIIGFVQMWYYRYFVFNAICRLNLTTKCCKDMGNRYKVWTFAARDLVESLDYYIVRSYVLDYYIQFHFLLLFT